MESQWEATHSKWAVVNDGILLGTGFQVSIEGIETSVDFCAPIPAKEGRV